jgi:ornithine cyclodeaminase
MNPSPNFPFSIITGRTIFRLVHDHLDGCMEAVQQAYLAHGEGRSVNPASFFLRFPDRPNARIIGLPSHLAAPWDVSGIKWISSYPDNIQKNFPRASAVLILNDHATGYPFACLEASVISASRTAASAVLAAGYLSPGKSRRVKNLGIVGTGLISRYIYRFLVGTGWEIETLHLYDMDPSQAERFRARSCDPKRHTSVRISPDLNSLLQSCEVIVFATVAGRPHVHDASLFSHHPLVLHVSLRDLAPELLLDACNIVDDIDHVMHADTSPHLAEQLTGRRDFVTGTLPDIITGRKTVDHSRTVIFSPFGLGVLDLAVGKWIYDQAVAAGEHSMIQDFFYDLER